MNWGEVSIEGKTYKLQSPPPMVGAWELPGGGYYIHAISKPCWLHRTMMKILLGWKWEDAK